MTIRVPTIVIVFSLTLAACGTTSTTTPTPTNSVLLRDDFNGSALDGGVWVVPQGAGTFLGRTQLRPPSQPPEVAGGILRLHLDTFNPTALTPGDSFWGAEIDSVQTFAVGAGLSIKARARLEGPLPAGIVGSVFAYALNPSGTTRDEIDTELSTSAPATALANVYRAGGFDSAGLPLSVPVSDITAFHTYEMDWFPDHVAWLIDGTQVRNEATVVPTQAMTARLNVWVPDATFAAAFRALLQPVSSAANDQTFYYDVDFVEVDSIAGTGGSRRAQSDSRDWNR